MKRSYRPILKIISFLLTITFILSDLAYAAPGILLEAQKTAIEDLRANPAQIQIPLDYSSLKETRKGTKNKMIIHIQDPHANYSGQLNLANTLDAIIKKYGVSLVLVEGGFGDASLTEVRKHMPANECKILAKSLLTDGQIAGEEYLNLISDRPMRIAGVENVHLYAKSLVTYADLAGKREDILAYLDAIAVSVNRLKQRMYPRELLEYENERKIIEGGSRANIDGLLALAGQTKVDLNDFPNFKKIAKLKKREKTVDYTAVNLELAVLIQKLEERGAGHDVRGQWEMFRRAKKSKHSYFALFQNILNIAYKKNTPLDPYQNFKLYGDYLKEFTEIDIDQLLHEMGKAEDRIYLSFLFSDRDARLLRAIDRYTGLLKTAYSIKMTTDDFKLFLVNEPDFATPNCLAFLNRKLGEYGWYPDMVGYRNVLDQGKEPLLKFYDSVQNRDSVFIKNAEKIMIREKQDVAVLITGGYHSPHLKELIAEKGYSLAVVTPVVTSETDQQKYEGLLLSPLGINKKKIKTVQGERKIDKLSGDPGIQIMSAKKNEGARQIEALARPFAVERMLNGLNKKAAVRFARRSTAAKTLFGYALREIASRRRETTVWAGLSAGKTTGDQRGARLARPRETNDGGSATKVLAGEALQHQMLRGEEVTWEGALGSLTAMGEDCFHNNTLKMFNAFLSTVVQYYNQRPDRRHPTNLWVQVYPVLTQAVALREEAQKKALFRQETQIIERPLKAGAKWDQPRILEVVFDAACSLARNPKINMVPHERMEPDMTPEGQQALLVRLAYQTVITSQIIPQFRRWRDVFIRAGLDPSLYYRGNPNALEGRQIEVYVEPVMRDRRVVYPEKPQAILATVGLGSFREGPLARAKTVALSGIPLNREDARSCLCFNAFGVKYATDVLGSAGITGTLMAWFIKVKKHYWAQEAFDASLRLVYPPKDAQHVYIDPPLASDGLPEVTNGKVEGATLYKAVGVITRAMLKRPEFKHAKSVLVTNVIARKISEDGSNGNKLIFSVCGKHTTNILADARESARLFVLINPNDGTIQAAYDENTREQVFPYENQHTILLDPPMEGGVIVGRPQIHCALASIRNNFWLRPDVKKARIVVSPHVSPVWVSEGEAALVGFEFNGRKIRTAMRWTEVSAQGKYTLVASPRTKTLQAIFEEVSGKQVYPAKKHLLTYLDPMMIKKDPVRPELYKACAKIPASFWREPQVAKAKQILIDGIQTYQHSQSRGRKDCTVFLLAGKRYRVDDSGQGAIKRRLRLSLHIESGRPVVDWAIDLATGKEVYSRTGAQAIATANLELKRLSKRVNVFLELLKKDGLSDKNSDEHIHIIDDIDNVSQQLFKAADGRDQVEERLLGEYHRIQERLSGGITPYLRKEVQSSRVAGVYSGGGQPGARLADVALPQINDNGLTMRDASIFDPPSLISPNGARPVGNLAVSVRRQAVNGNKDSNTAVGGRLVNPASVAPPKPFKRYIPKRPRRPGKRQDLPRPHGPVGPHKDAPLRHGRVDGSYLETMKLRSSDLQIPAVTLRKLDGMAHGQVVALARHLKEGRVTNLPLQLRTGPRQEALSFTTVYGIEEIANHNKHQVDKSLGGSDLFVGGAFVRMTVRGNNGNQTVFLYPIAANELNGARLSGIAEQGESGMYILATSESLHETDLVLKSGALGYRLGKLKSRISGGQRTSAVDFIQKLGIAIEVGRDQMPFAGSIAVDLARAMTAFYGMSVEVKLFETGQHDFSAMFASDTRVLVFADGTNQDTLKAIETAGPNFGIMSATPMRAGKQGKFSAANYIGAAVLGAMFADVSREAVRDLVYGSQGDQLDMIFSILYNRTVSGDDQILILQHCIRYDGADPNNQHLFKDYILPLRINLTREIISAASRAMMRAIGSAA